MDRLKREGNPPVGQLASPVPQYKDTVLNDWAELQGEGGASYVKDKDVLAKLEQARVLLAGVATETKLEEARALLESVAGKDFATQATLAQVKSELELVKAELATIKANQLSGDQKVQLSGTLVERQVFSGSIGAGASIVTTTFDIRGRRIGASVYAVPGAGNVSVAARWAVRNGIAGANNEVKLIDNQTVTNNRTTTKTRTEAQSTSGFLSITNHGTESRDFVVYLVEEF